MNEKTQQFAMPAYVTNETSEGVKLFFDLSGGVASDMNLLLSEDKTRLMVVGKKFFAAFEDEFLWSFEVPRSTDREKISVEQFQDFYLISLPKNKFWSHISPNLRSSFYHQQQVARQSACL